MMCAFVRSEVKELVVYAFDVLYFLIFYMSLFRLAYRPILENWNVYVVFVVFFRSVS